METAMASGLQAALTSMPARPPARTEAAEAAYWNAQIGRLFEGRPSSHATS